MTCTVRLQSLSVHFGGDHTFLLMELDTQVEQTVLPDTSNPEHKRKHRSKDKHKHKHKHHKKSKRDRHANVDGDVLDEESGPVEVAAPTGFEDGELPGPPSTAHDLQPALVHGSADLSSADAVDKLSAEQQLSTSQPDIRSVTNVHDWQCRRQ